MSSFEIPSQPLSVGRVAAICQVDRTTVFRWIRSGRLHAHRTPGGHHRVQPAELVNFAHRYGMALDWSADPGTRRTRNGSANGSGKARRAKRNGSGNGKASRSGNGKASRSGNGKARNGSRKATSRAKVPAPITNDELTFLCVDDDEDILPMYRAYLVDRFGPCKVKFAYNGFEACIQTGLHLPDLIILDLNMPRMTGEEACRSIKQVGDTEQIPIVVVSAHLDNETVTRLFGMGVDQVFPKPTDMDALMETVALTLQRSRERFGPGPQRRNSGRRRSSRGTESGADAETDADS